GLQGVLVGTGFVEHHDPLLTNRWHHLTTLGSTTGLKVEVHKLPRWPGRLRPPPTREILDASVPSALGVVGISAPTPLHHALILAAHAWHHEPLWTLRDLIDIAAVSALVDRRDLDRTAKVWGLGRLWRTTERAIEGLFYGGRKTFPLRTWARHLGVVRDRTGLEKHVAQLVDGFWGMPPHLAPVPTIRVLRYMITPAPGESWRQRAARVPQDLGKLPAPAGRRGEPPAPTPREPPLS
nr:nucleotidyltransferase family protein [Gemmatimonadaceae bacterium]